MEPTTNPPQKISNLNRPLIVAGLVLGMLLLGLLGGLVAMYIANFNLLEWME